MRIWENQYKKMLRQSIAWSARRLSTKTPPPPPPPKGDLFDRLFNFIGNKNLLVGGAIVVGGVVLLPPFANTREGFLAGFRYEPSKPAMWFYEALAGGLGVFGGSSVAATYLKRRSLRVADPLLLGLRLPYAVVGGMIGACTCFALSDHMVRFSTKIGKTIGYTVDGFLMDVSDLTGGREEEEEEKEEEVGRDVRRPWDSQNETFDNSTWSVFSVFNVNNENTTEAVKNNRRELDKSREKINAQNAAVTVTDTATTEVEKEFSSSSSSSSSNVSVREKHLDNLVASLVGLRQKEYMLREQYEQLDSNSVLAQSIQVEINNCGDEKIMIKKEGKKYGCQHLSTLLSSKVNSHVTKLSELRIEQEKLAMVAADRLQDETTKRKAMQTLRRMDQQKAMIKKIAKEKYGKNISGLAVNRINWKRTIAEATALDLTIKV